VEGMERREERAEKRGDGNRKGRGGTAPYANS